jgi:hypothetical protein
MKWTLVLILLSFGQHTETFSTAEECQDVFLEALIVKGDDVFSAVCVGPENEILISAGADLGP